MGDFTIKRISDMEGRAGGTVRKARAELGVTSFGLSFESFPPNMSQYPEHDHSGDGQEEVYIVVAGSGTIEIDGQPHRLEPEVAVRVAPGTMRKIVTGPEGIKLVVIGGVPGQVYAAPAASELDAT